MQVAPFALAKYLSIFAIKPPFRQDGAFFYTPFCSFRVPLCCDLFIHPRKDFPVLSRSPFYDCVTFFHNSKVFSQTVLFASHFLFFRKIFHLFSPINFLVFPLQFALYLLKYNFDFSTKDCKYFASLLAFCCTLFYFCLLPFQKR